MHAHLGLQYLVLGPCCIWDQYSIGHKKKELWQKKCPVFSAIFGVVQNGALLFELLNYLHKRAA
jgi:hypothetical protein